MTTLTISVAATADDGVDWAGTWYTTGESADNILKQGRYAGYTEFSAFRFQVSVGHGVTINSAYLRLYCLSQTNTPTILFNCENVDNSSALSGTLPSARSLTTAQTSYATSANEFSTPQSKDFDITGPVAEVYARAGFVDNNYLTVITQDPVTGHGGTAFVGVEDYSHAGGHKPTLVINYTAAATGTKTLTLLGVG